MRTILLLALMVPVCCAQTIEVESLFQPAPLSGIWKHQIGDDPRWADPAFDDSAWPGVPMPEGAVQPGDGFSWYRFRVRLPENMPSEPLALMIGAFGNSQAYELFWNGKRAGVAGEPAGGVWGLLLPRPKAFPVAGYARTAVIAIRLRTATLPSIPRIDSAHRTSWIGARQPIDVSVKAWQDERLQRALPSMLIAASIVAPAVFFLLLALWRRDAPEYFWFGLWLVGATVVPAVGVYPEAFAVRTGLAVSWIVILASAVTNAAWVGVLSALFRSRVTLPAWLAAAAGLILGSGPVLFATAGGSLARISSMIATLQNFGWLSFIYYYLGWRTSRLRERVPAIHVAIVAYLLTNFAMVGGQLVWPSETLYVQGAWMRTVVLLLFTFAMALLMNQRSALLLGERQRLSGELASAAEVQSLLLTSLPTVGGSFQIEPVYLPASEVGGDFYRIFSAGDGAILVVVGDVSGKGLRAAMTVSGLVGAMEAIRTRMPGAFLEELNRAASAHMASGFATCCKVLIKPNGDAVIANAGHPAPYCDGQEVELEAGLPLGIAPAVEYPESVTCGERFTLVSDGVVEAENAQRELFGFDRTREISGKSAKEIAEAAKAWGQNDDITVVTVRRNS